MNFSKKACFSRISRLKVTYMFMALTNSLVVLFIAVLLHILTKLLQQCFLFFIVVVIPGHNLGNSQVSVYRTIGPTLVSCSSQIRKKFILLMNVEMVSYSKRSYLSLVLRKPVFGVFDQVRYKPGCTTTQDG